MIWLTLLYVYNPRKCLSYLLLVDFIEKSHVHKNLKYGVIWKKHHLSYSFYYVEHTFPETNGKKNACLPTSNQCALTVTIPSLKFKGLLPAMSLFVLLSFGRDPWINRHTQWNFNKSKMHRNNNRIPNLRIYRCSKCSDT